MAPLKDEAPAGFSCEGLEKVQHPGGCRRTERSTPEPEHAATEAARRLARENLARVRKYGEAAPESPAGRKAVSSPQTIRGRRFLPDGRQVQTAPTGRPTRAEPKAPSALSPEDLARREWNESGRLRAEFPVFADWQRYVHAREAWKADAHVRAEFVEFSDYLAFTMAMEGRGSGPPDG